VAGSKAPAGDLLDALLEGDWDPEEHDRRMASAFGDDYYEARWGRGLSCLFVLFGGGVVLGGNSVRLSQGFRAWQGALVTRWVWVCLCLFVCVCVCVRVCVCVCV
jgi:hypothetical protein